MADGWRRVCCTRPPTPRQALDVLGAHVLDRLDRDGEGDGGRQLPVVGDDLLRHRVAHLLMDVDTARPQLAMANGPILLARHSLVLNSGLLLLSLLGWGLL